MEKKRYKIIKGSGGGANEKTIGIEHNTNPGSLSFVSKVRDKAVEYFGNGASLDVIGTTYGVHVRYDDEKKNRRIVRLLIKIVEAEEELKELNPKRWKK